MFLQIDDLVPWLVGQVEAVQKIRQQADERDTDPKDVIEKFQSLFTEIREELSVNDGKFFHLLKNTYRVRIRRSHQKKFCKCDNTGYQQKNLAV